MPSDSTISGGNVGYGGQLDQLLKKTKVEEVVTMQAESVLPEPEPIESDVDMSEPDSGPKAPNTSSEEDEPMESCSAATKVSIAHLQGIVRNPRFRKSCYFNATVRAGCLDWSSYNHMLLPCKYDWYKSPEDEYYHLKNHVCICDVAVERQVELFGPDALTLAELMTPRPLASMAVGDCRYAIIVDDEGMVLNDPIVSRIADDRFWLSSADGDLVLWAKGLAIGRGLKVKVTEAAVSPLALQGPKSPALVAELFGEWVYDLKYFKFKEVKLNGMPIVLARSGWSPEVGYELYLQDESRGEELWRCIWEVGKKYDLKLGSPNQKRRIEGGMFNFGSDITTEHNLCELGLPPSWTGAPSKCKEVDFIGKEALGRIHEEGGPKRLIVGLEFLEKEACPALTDFWDIHAAPEGANESCANIGHITSVTHSPTLDAWIGMATVGKEFAEPGTKVCVQTPGGSRFASVRKLPFLPRAAMLTREEYAQMSA